MKVERKDADDDDRLLHKKEAKDEPRCKDRVTEGDVERSRDDRMLAVNLKNRAIDQVEKDNAGNLALEKESNTFNVRTYWFSHFPLIYLIRIKIQCEMPFLFFF